MIKPNISFPTLKVTPRNQEISRLLSAAVISNQFRSMLLCDPVSATARGYSGERFSLENKDIEKLGTIRAETLTEFAAQLAAI